MSDGSTSRETDAAFEHALLASARLDAPEDGAAKLAFSRFALTAATVTALEPPTSVGSAGAAARSVAKWLSLGVFMSGAVVAAYVLGTKHAPTAGPSATPPTIVASNPSAIVVSLPASAPPAPPAPPTSTPMQLPARAAAVSASARAASTSRAASSTPPRIAEEVSRLDAARTALAIGDFNTVSRLLESYNADFPHGVLAREADVVAISALTEKGDSAGALRRAQRFLANYPHDLHATRVKQLVSWQAATNVAP